MIEFSAKRALSIGEAMLEMASAGPNLYRQGFAGDTFNTIWHMAQLLGKDTCGFVTRVGTEAFSSRFIQRMRDDGLDVSGVGRDPERQMGLYLIELNGVERSFHYWRKDSAARRLADDRELLDRTIAGAGLIHLSGITLAILSPQARDNLFASLAEARKHGAIVSFDPNIRPRLWSGAEETRLVVAEMLRHTDIALPSFDDEKALWGDASPAETLSRISGYGVREIAVKDGSNPVVAVADGETVTISTPPVVDIVDTTGAGDAFNAGFLSARMRGLALAPAIATGQKLSAEVIRTYGALAGSDRIKNILD